MLHMITNLCEWMLFLCDHHHRILLYLHVYRKRVSSVVEHSSANPKVPGSILDLVSYRGHGL